MADQTTRFVCTKDDPYTPEKAGAFRGFAMHPDARRISTDSDFTLGLEYDNYLCPNCGKEFSIEVPL